MLPALRDGGVTEGLAMTASNKMLKPPTKQSCTLKILTYTQNETKILTIKDKSWERQYLW